MKVELPELKRCCFCIPLRHGLIAWGYVKLVSLLLLISFVTFAFMASSMRMLEEIVLTSIFSLVLVLDICLTIVFLVGGHRKSAKLLHVYYIYNIVILCLYTLFYTWSTALELMFMGSYVEHMPHGYATFIPLIQVRLLVGISNLGIQVYVILLIRSEVNKLRNSSKYRFSNPTAEVKHSLENGTNEQGINYSHLGSNENGTDSQFEGIINQTKKADDENFNYNKF